MKWGVCFLALMTLTATINGCASLGSFYHELHEVTREDANKIHPHSRQQDTHKRLTAEESRSINRLYGKDISRAGDLIAYYNARWYKPLFPLTKGNIFLVHARTGNDESLAILVCTTDGKIDEVLLKNNLVVSGKHVVSVEFLQQFVGRSLDHSWEIAKDPSDLLSLPEKIRPLADYPNTSDEIANAIRKVLIWAKVLGID